MCVIIIVAVIYAVTHSAIVGSIKKKPFSILQDWCFIYKKQIIQGLLYLLRTTIKGHFRSDDQNGVIYIDKHTPTKRTRQDIEK